MPPRDYPYLSIDALNCFRKLEGKDAIRHQSSQVENCTKCHEPYQQNVLKYWGPKENPLYWRKYLKQPYKIY